MATRYEVNAKTINKALADLALEGLIVRHVGRGTFVASSEHSTAVPLVKKRTYGWLSGDSSNPPNGQAFYRQAAEAIEALGHRLEMIHLSANISEECCSRTFTPNQLRELSGLILFSTHPSEQLLAELNRRHMPMVIANNRHETIRTPVVQADYAHGAFELTQHLIQLGHRDIRLAIDACLLPAAGDAIGGHQAAMGRYGLPTLDSIQVGTGMNWYAVLNVPKRPTALICVGTRSATEATRVAAEAGIGVPDHLSLAAIPEPDASHDTEQRFTTYEVPSDRIVEWATKLLLTASPCGVPQMVVVPGKLHVRGSTARPAADTMPLINPPRETLM